MDAVIAAWNDAGSPRLTEMIVCARGVDAGELAGARESDDLTELLLAERIDFSDPAVVRTIGQSTEPSVPTELKILAHAALRTCRSGDATTCQEAQQIRGVLARQLAARLPETIQYELEVILDDSNLRRRPEETLAELERISCRDAFQYPQYKLYQWIVAELRRRGVERAEQYALNPLSYLVNDRVEELRRIGFEAERGPKSASRIRIGHALQRIGRAQIRENSFVGWSSGAVLIELGAKLVEDDGVQDRSRVARMYMTLLFERSSNAAEAVKFWPIPSVSEKTIRASLINEIELLHRFAQMTPPGNLSDSLLGGVGECDKG